MAVFIYKHNMYVSGIVPCTIPNRTSVIKQIIICMIRTFSVINAEIFLVINSFITMKWSFMSKTYFKSCLFFTFYYKYKSNNIFRQCWPTTYILIILFFIWLFTHKIYFYLSVNSRAHIYFDWLYVELKNDDNVVNLLLTEYCCGF